MINQITSIFAAACSPSGSFLDFPTWYEYLSGKTVNGVCQPQLSSIGDVWLIVAAVIEILLRIASIAAVLMLIYAGFSFTTSDGDPEKASRARSTIINALVGLAIAVMASVIIDFIAGSLS